MKKALWFFLIPTILFLALTGFSGGELTAIQALAEKGGAIPSILAITWGGLVLLKKYPPTITIVHTFDNESKRLITVTSEVFEQYKPFLSHFMPTPPKVQPQPNPQPNPQPASRNPPTLMG